MNILTLDLGTTTGYAFSRGGDLGEPLLGSLSLATSKEIKEWNQTRMVRRCDPRAERLCNKLLDVFLWPDLVVFEDVQFQSYTQQCQLWSSLRAAVWLVFQNTAGGPRPIFECVPVTTLKKFATGHGGATKTMMCAAAIRGMPCRFKVVPGKFDRVFDKVNKIELDDNAIDAYHLWQWAKQNLGRIKK